MNDMAFRHRLQHPVELEGALPAAFGVGLAHPRLSVVVPCFNEEACLDALYSRLSEAVRAQVGDDYEIVLVDDGSRDRTWQIISAFSAADPHIRAVRLSRNHGHQPALSAGLDLCNGELILIIDADLQDPPELLGAMIDRLEQEQADVVYGLRTHRSGETVAKRALAKAFYRVLAHVSDGVDIPLDSGDFRLMTRRALDVLQAMPERSRFVRGMVAWIGFRQVAISYERDERLAGTTKYPLVKMCRLAADALTSFSTAPLRLASYAGFVLSLCSIAMIGYALCGWLEGRTVPGWTSLMIVALAMGAVQMFVLGVIGEYIGRIYHQAKGRPLYIVSEMASHKDAPVAHVRPSLGIVASSCNAA